MFYARKKQQYSYFCYTLFFQSALINNQPNAFFSSIRNKYIRVNVFSIEWCITWYSCIKAIKVINVNAFMHNTVKWTNILFKMLRCEHRKVLKYVWPFCNIMHKRVKLKAMKRSYYRKFMISMKSWKLGLHWYFPIRSEERGHWFSFDWWLFLSKVHDLIFSC